MARREARTREARTVLGLLVGLALAAHGCASSGEAPPPSPDGYATGTPAWRLPPQCAVSLPRSPAGKGRRGKRSHAGVSEAQSTLNALGYDCGPVDGLIGSKTRECITRFQRDRALPVTGILDAGTMQAIRGE